MRVIIVSGTYYEGAYSQSYYLQKLVDYLLESSLYVTLITMIPQNKVKKKSWIKSKQGITHYTCPVSSKNSFYSQLKFTIYAFKMLLSLRKMENAVIHAINPCPVLILLVSFRGLWRNIPMIYDLRGPWIDFVYYYNPFLPKKIKHLIMLLEREAVKRVEKLIVISPKLENYITSLYRILEEKITIIPSLIDIELKEDINPFQDVVRLIYVGTVITDRGLDTFIHALKILVKNARADALKVNFSLEIIGDTNPPVPIDKRIFRRVKQLIRRLELDENVLFTGHIPHKKVAKELSRSHIGLIYLPATLVYAASSPIKLMEYLASGLVVVGNDQTAIKTVIEHGKNGYIVDGSPQSYASQIDEIIGHPREAMKIRKNAIESVKRYLWKSSVEKYVKVYDEARVQQQSNSY